LFDYLDGGFDVEIGQRVAVSFGRRKHTVPTRSTATV
jgi:hypothetical protein